MSIKLSDQQMNYISKNISDKLIDTIVGHLNSQIKLINKDGKIEISQLIMICLDSSMCNLMQTLHASLNALKDRNSSNEYRKIKKSLIKDIEEGFNRNIKLLKNNT